LESPRTLVNLPLPRFITKDKDRLYARLRYLLWTAITKPERSIEFTGVSITLCPVNDWEFSNVLEVATTTCIDWIQASPEKSQNFQSVVLYMENKERFDSAVASIDAYCQCSGHFCLIDC